MRGKTADQAEPVSAAHRCDANAELLVRKVHRYGVGMVTGGVLLVPTGFAIGLDLHFSGRQVFLPWLPFLFGFVFIAAGIEALRRAVRGRRLLGGDRDVVRIWVGPQQRVSQKVRGRVVSIEAASGPRKTGFINSPAARPPRFQAENAMGVLLGAFSHGEWIILACDRGACFGRLEPFP